jgi:hypothetical protein
LKELAAFFTEWRSKLVVATEPLFEGAASEPQTPSVLQSLTVLSPAMKEDTAGLETSFVLDSPRFLSEDTGIFSAPPQLSFDVEDEDLNPFSSLANSQLADLVALLKEFHHRFVGLKTKWAHTFLEVDTSHTLVVKDLKSLHDQTKNFKVKLLAVEDLCKKMDSTFSFKLQHLEDCLTTFGMKEDTQMAHLERLSTDVQSCQESLISTSADLSHQIQGLTSTLAALETKLGVIDKMTKEFDKRFSIIFPILKDARHSKAASTHFLEMQQQLQDLSEKVNSMDQEAWHQISGTSSPTSVTHPPLPGAAYFQDLKHQIKVLQHHIVGGGIKIGTKVFQSFEDVQLWVKAQLPIRRYGLFVDAISILDFFSCLGHIDAENQVSTLHNANKAGFTSIYESRVATSVQNVFPKVFGKGDSHQYLPAIPHADKWDDGTDGLVYHITRGMTDVETQLSSAIDTILEAYPEARAIASQCLFQAKRFVIDLCSFMSKVYFKWVARGHSKQEAWNMTSLCVHRVFEEIHSKRVVARDIYDPNDLEFTTAKMLWATWKAHGVMEQYLRHNFYEHPSISAVLA